MISCVTTGPLSCLHSLVLLVFGPLCPLCPLPLSSLLAALLSLTSSLLLPLSSLWCGQSLSRARKATCACSASSASRRVMRGHVLHRDAVAPRHTSMCCIARSLSRFQCHCSFSHLLSHIVLSLLLLACTFWPLTCTSSGTLVWCWCTHVSVVLVYTC